MDLQAIQLIDKRKLNHGLMMSGVIFLQTMLFQASSQAAVSIDEFKGTSSPAANILGITPSSIVNPQSPQALSVELLTALQNKTTNYGLEFTPFWLFSDHPDLVLDVNDYLNPNSSLLNKLGSSVIENFSLSMSSSPNTNNQNNSQNASILSFGARTMFIDGTPNIDELKLKKTDIEGKLLALISDPDNENLKKDIIDLGGQIQKIMRSGFNLETSSAISFTNVFNANSTPSISADKLGVWITPSYSMLFNPSTGQALDVLMVARGLFTLSANTNNIALDFGARAIYRHNEFFSFSGEYVQRFIQSSTQRFGGVAEFKIAENTYLAASVGKDFDNVLFSILGVNINFGKDPFVVFPK